VILGGIWKIYPGPKLACGERSTCGVAFTRRRRQRPGPLLDIPHCRHSNRPLAALSLKGHPAHGAFIEQFTGSHRFVLDYLTEKVLRALPVAQRQFLLRTSILEKFGGPLCRAVTGNAASPQTLDEIRRGDLFLIPLDAGGRWFLYPHLFAKVLRALLECGTMTGPSPGRTPPV
jgi:hypothetical protein